LYTIYEFKGEVSLKKIVIDVVGQEQEKAFCLSASIVINKRLGKKVFIYTSKH
jgi:hypothetical protein